MKWYKVEGVEYNGNPFVKKVKTPAREICLVATEGELLAVSVRCPHAGADLSRGWCKDGKLVCPIHRFSYDIHTGKGSPGQNDYIDTFPVRMKNGSIYVGINSFWDRLKNMFK